MTKNIIMAAFVSLLAANVWADNELKYRTFRATETSTGETYSLLSTGSIIVLWDLEVTSGTPVTGKSTFQIYTSTEEGPNYTRNISQSTSALYDITTTGDRFEIGQVIGGVYGKSVFYTKTGNTTVRLRYEILGKVQKGLETKGLK